MTVESNDTQCILRLEGDCSLASAAELKTALAEGLACAAKEDKELSLDLGNAREIDVTAWQLLWAARHAAELNHRRFVTRAPEAVRALARDAGFDGFFGAVVEVEQAIEMRVALEG